MRVPSLVLIAQAVVLLERGQTDKQTHKQTPLNALPTPAPRQPACVMSCRASMLSLWTVISIRCTMTTQKR